MNYEEKWRDLQVLHEKQIRPFRHMAQAIKHLALTLPEPNTWETSLDILLSMPTFRTALLEALRGLVRK